MLTDHDIAQAAQDRELARRRSREGRYEYALRQIAVGSGCANTRHYANVVLGDQPIPGVVNEEVTA